MLTRPQMKRYARAHYKVDDIDALLAWRSKWMDEYSEEIQKKCGVQVKEFKTFDKTLTILQWGTGEEIVATDDKSLMRAIYTYLLVGAPFNPEESVNKGLLIGIVLVALSVLLWIPATRGVLLLILPLGSGLDDLLFFVVLAAAILYNAYRWAISMIN